jgi:hypothetical protein
MTTRLTLLPTFLVLAAACPARAEEWASVRGRVVWAEKKLPERKKIDVTIDRKACLAKGPLYDESLVVNPKNRGVRWAVVWLVDAGDPKKPLPVPGALKKPAPEKVLLSTPCCRFEPRVLAMWGPQTLVVKGAKETTHNVMLFGGAAGPNFSPIFPPGWDQMVVKHIRPRLLPINVVCAIHPWMKAWVFVFAHPYFAVTDADGAFFIPKVPPGKYRLVAWHEASGWVFGGKSPLKGGGKPVDLRGKVDVGAIELRVE